jgi:hypothetical protein
MNMRLCGAVCLVVLAVAGHAVAGAPAGPTCPPTCPPTDVPEIDASGAATALSVLAGFVALAAERLRRK